MKRKISIFLLLMAMVLSLCGCSNNDANEEMLNGPFIMTAYETYLNGALKHTYPTKTFNTGELFYALNEASADEPFAVDFQKIVYIVKMTNNGDDYTSYVIWNDGYVEMKYNFLFDSTFCLTEKQYNKVIDIISGEAQF